MKYFNIVKNKITDKEPLDINQQLVISLNKKRIPNWSQIKQLPKFLNKGENRDPNRNCATRCLRASNFNYLS